MNKCCQADRTYDLSNELLKAGVTVTVSIGGDGCQGSPSQVGDVMSLSDDAIIASFKNFT